MKSNQCQKYPVPLIQIAVDSALIVRVSCKSYEAVYLLSPIGSEYGTGRLFRNNITSLSAAWLRRVALYRILYIA